MNVSVDLICTKFGRSRQAYYQYQSRASAQSAFEQRIVSIVLEVRKKQPMIGVRKLQYKLNTQHRQLIGRDHLFAILRRYNLLVKRKKRYVKTTNSYHRFRVYKNLIKNYNITKPNQVHVADITYISLLDGFCFLSLLTDVYSRKIVGYCLSKSLGIDGCIKTLKMALKGVKHPEQLIHHSDRGIQYCSHAYVGLLVKNKVKISMTEENHVYENSIAERVNGILKNEFMLGERLVSYDVAQNLVAESIRIYNNERPHTSLNYQTPNAVYVSGMDNTEVINIKSTSYPQKKGTYQHISQCLKSLKFNQF